MTNRHHFITQLTVNSEPVNTKVIKPQEQADLQR